MSKCCRSIDHIRWVVKKTNVEVHWTQTAELVEEKTTFFSFFIGHVLRSNTPPPPPRKVDPHGNGARKQHHQGKHQGNVWFTDGGARRERTRSRKVRIQFHSERSLEADEMAENIKTHILSVLHTHTYIIVHDLVGHTQGYICTHSDSSNQGYFDNKIKCLG